VTYFANDFENLLVYDFAIPGMLNTGLASSDGVEVALAAVPVERVTLQAAYTYLTAEDDSANIPLLRRPRHRFSGQFTVQVTDALLVGAGIEGVSGGYDGSTSAPTSAPGWTVARFF